MVRLSAPWAVASLLLLSCGPDKRPCSGVHPDFEVVLKLSGRSLPPDTVVHVTYGGSGMEDYRLAVAAADAKPTVLFCRVADDAGEPLDASLAAAGAPGDDPSPVAALYCELWTGGFTTLEVHGSGIDPKSFELTPRPRECPVIRTLTLDTPDAG